MDTNSETPATRPAIARPTTDHNAWRAAAAALCCGLVLGWFGSTGCTTSRQGADLKLVSEAWNTIQKQYVDPSAVQPKELTYGAISGMVDSLGDTGHSTFLTPKMVRELKNLQRGEFKGVGLEIRMNKEGRVVVVAPLDGTPAERAGIRPGDLILKVADQDVTDWPLSEVVEKIAGRPGTRVSLTLQDPHTGRIRDFELLRAAIKVHEVAWRQLPGTRVAHLRLASFEAGVTKDLRKALLQIQESKLTGVILDLRNNPGGLLDEAVSVASQFLKTGDVLKAKNGKGQMEGIPVESGGVATDIPLVVLVNEGSASAAEIVAGALQDAHRCVLLGETTFGTGTVLQEFRLSDGSALLLAVEEWLTPKGRSFWHKGITPDYVVALPEDVMPLLPVSEKNLTPEQLQASDDRQLLRALDLINHGQPPTDLTQGRDEHPVRYGVTTPNHP